MSNSPLLNKKSLLSPSSLPNYSYYGKEQIILPDKINSIGISPSKTPIYTPPIDPNYVVEGYVFSGYVN